MIDDYTICRMVRTLINTHEKNITMATLMRKFNINRSDTGTAYELINNKLLPLGMELAESQKLLIVKRKDRRTINNKINSDNSEEKTDTMQSGCDAKVKELIIIGTLIVLEGGKIEKSKFESLKSMISFKFCLNLQRLGYIAEIKINEDLYVELGWRFLLEFPRFEPAMALNLYCDE